MVTAVIHRLGLIVKGKGKKCEKKLL
jgi:hypothetical protein